MGNKFIDFFEFLETNRGKKIPFIVKLLIYPERLTAEDLNVSGYLDLEGTQVRSLPAGLVIRGGLNLERTQIRSLPDRLEVGGSLFMGNTQIDSLPAMLIVIKSLYLEGTPLAKKYTVEQIRAMIEGKGGKVIRTIYV